MDLFMKMLRERWKGVLVSARKCDMESALQEFKFIVESEVRACDLGDIETEENSARLRRECDDVMTVDEQGMKAMARILQEQCTSPAALLPLKPQTSEGLTTRVILNEQGDASVGGRTVPRKPVDIREDIDLLYDCEMDDWLDNTLSKLYDEMREAVNFWGNK